jgi:hypothetical protein
MGTMDTEKLGLTLFDILGYLIPGYLVVFMISVFEATFLSTSFFPLVTIGNNLFLFSLMAYFLGIVCHGLSTLVQNKFSKLFSSDQNRLNPLLSAKFFEAIADTFNIKSDNNDQKLHSLDKYLLADSFILTEGFGEERMSLMVREGFFKTSMFAFLISTLVSIGSLFVGGLSIQTEVGKITAIGIIPTLICAVLSFGITALFRDRFIFYNRIKINNTALIFLACYAKKKLNDHPRF